MGLRTVLGLKKKPKAEPKPVPTAALATKKETASVYLHSFSNYQTYRQVQNEGNARKIDLVFELPANTHHIAKRVLDRVGDTPRILCHGTRNGAELRYFRESLPNAHILGTEIADTATRFADTIQWDFHDIKDEWRGRWDVVYSNSWDHAFDPDRAFRNWISCLSHRGMMMLLHTEKHTPKFANELDPFGATMPAFIEYLTHLSSPVGRSVSTIDDLPERSLRETVVIVS